MPLSLSRLWRKSTIPESTLLSRLESLLERQETLLAVPEMPLKILEKLEAFEVRLAAMEKQISRAGREQLKTGTLLEAQQEKLGEALEQLKTAANGYTKNLEEQREQSRREAEVTRLDMVRNLFPVLDGLDEALRAGKNLLAAPETSHSGLFGRPKIQPGEEKLRQSLTAWLQGLELVRQRQLDLLAAEGVQLIPTIGQPYNPQYQVVVEVVAAGENQPVGTVVSEFRRGYMTNNRVLRYAEVSVANDRP